MSNNKEPQELKELFSVKVIVTEKHNKPCVEIRKATTNYELIKKIVSCAFHDTPLIILPQFPDKVKSINTLIERGIVYKEGNEFFFTM